MSEFKPLHDVSKSGRMAFADGPEGECVAVFDLVRWLLHSGACGDISPAIQTTIDKLRAAVAGGCAVYRASTSAYWARPVGDGDVLRQENPGGWVTGRVISYPDFVAGEAVQRTVHGKGSHRPYRPALVGPSGAIEWLGELLANCCRFDAFQSVSARKTVPHFGIRRADAVALFGYPPASTGEVQVGVSQAAAATGDKAESTHEAAVATLEDRVVELYDSGVLSPSEIVRRIGRDSWPPGKPDSARTSVSRMIARHQQKKAKAIEERQKAARAGPWDQAKPA